MFKFSIPKFKIKYLYNEKNKVKGVLLKFKDFEKLIEKIEDLVDYLAIKNIKDKEKTYTFEEIRSMIKSKK